MHQHLDLSGCPLLHESLRTVRVVIQPESSDGAPGTHYMYVLISIVIIGDRVDCAVMFQVVSPVALATENRRSTESDGQRSQQY